MLEGRARGPGAAALRYHGMLQGLAIVLRTTPSAATPVATAMTTKVVPADAAFVRLLANIVLRTHTELMHVY